MHMLFGWHVAKFSAHFDTCSSNARVSAIRVILLLLGGTH